MGLRGRVIEKILPLALSLLPFALPLPSRAQTPEAPPERVLNLEDSIRLALLNDAQFLSAEQDIKIGEQRVREARTLFYPEIGFGANAIRYHAESPFVLQSESGAQFLQPGAADSDRLVTGRAFLTQNLYSGGRTNNTLKLAQAGLKQARARYEAAKLDVTLGVRKVFYDTLAAQQKSGLLRARLEAAEQALAGPGLSAWERLEAEALLEALRGMDAAARHELGQARLEVLKALNLELDTRVQLDGALATQPAAVELEKVSVWAIELRPELQSEVYQAQMDSIAVNLAFARRLPTMFFGADYEYTGRDLPLRRNNWAAMLGLRIPITYDFFTQLRQRRAELRQGQIKRAELQDQVKLQVHQSWEALEFWQAEWQRRLKALGRARELYAAARGAAGSGLARARALRGLAEIEVGQLEAVKEHLLAKAKLERAVGRSLD